MVWSLAQSPDARYNEAVVYHGQGVFVKKILFFNLLLFGCMASTALALDLTRLVREIEEQYNGRSSVATMQMEVSTAHWQRSLTLQAWSQGRDQFLVRILEPAKEKGVATLKIDKQVWNYLPRVDRTIKIPPSMMGGAWMGSHITNNDLVKAARIEEDYQFSLQSEDAQSWTIDGNPKPDAAVVWGKIVYQIEKPRRIPRWIDYYDEQLNKVRRISFDQVQTIGNRTLPLRMTIVPLDKSDERTILTYLQLSFDLELDPAIFSLGRLRMP
jgi:outer membrane lipoprotein-sorting protein